METPKTQSLGPRRQTPGRSLMLIFYQLAQSLWHTVVCRTIADCKASDRKRGKILTNIQNGNWFWFEMLLQKRREANLLVKKEKQVNNLSVSRSAQAYLEGHNGGCRQKRPEEERRAEDTTSISSLNFSPSTVSTR